MTDWVFQQTLQSGLFVRRPWSNRVSIFGSSRIAPKSAPPNTHASTSDPGGILWLFWESVNNDVVFPFIISGAAIRRYRSFEVCQRICSWSWLTQVWWSYSRVTGTLLDVHVGIGALAGWSTCTCSFGAWSSFRDTIQSISSHSESNLRPVRTGASNWIDVDRI